MQNIFKKLSPFYYLMGLFLAVSFILRIVLIFHPITDTNFDFIDIFKIFFVGIFSDVFVFAVASAFLWLYLIFISNSRYTKPYGYIFFGLLVSLWLYIYSGKSVLNEYGGVLPEIGLAFVGFKTICFGLMLFLPNFRGKIRLVVYSITVFIYVFAIVQNVVSEYFFWNEFGVKYNFIAVNYLVYTNEVIGNIMESYPVVPLYSAMFCLVVALTFFIVKYSRNYIEQIPNIKEKLKITGIYFALFFLSLFAIPLLSKAETSQNLFANELQANGVYRFYHAFVNSELDYFRFYKTIPQENAFAILRREISPDIKNESTLRQIQPTAPEIHKNVVLISVESLSASFMKTYGDQENITPFLDSLATQSLFLTNLYAVGNRTVRGLEALSMSIPPTAGESVVKRKDNKNKFSAGYIFKEKGYHVKYLYGGDAFFDNMEDYFSGNGFDIVDKKTLSPEEITFYNIWGVCDEDMATKAIMVMNEEAKSGKPFFNQWMTVSNHRPFTYPENKIDIPADSKSRAGGVKYTDYALRRFFAMASKQAWYSNTIFVIVADHCASSAGKTELPIDKYRIPALIFAPNFVKPQQFNEVCSQIDIMPTVFGLLNFNYKTKFYGQDVLKPDFKPRALIATYQDLGLIKNNVLTIISPKQTVKQYQLVAKPNQEIPAEFLLYHDQILLSEENKDLIDETIAYYQTASFLLKEKKYEYEL